MKKELLATLALTSSLYAGVQEAGSVSEMFTKAKANGNIKYYYIQTDKDFASAPSTSANANTIGGQLSYTTARFQGFNAKATFMTTNGFALDSDVAKVDTSILGKDNGAFDLAHGGNNSRAKQSFSVLGEAYLAYTYKDFKLLFGRQVIKTPLVNAKVVRLLPSAVQGTFVTYKPTKEVSLGVAYLDKFKQRTSDRFRDIIEHALGTDTQLITGAATGNVVVADAEYKTDSLHVKLYDYYASDFMNSAYLDAIYKYKLSKDTKLTFGAQYINQFSVGNADTYFNDNPTYAGGKIKANAFGLKACASFKEAKFMLGYSKVLKDDNAHDSLVLPWDGTPLFTNMITSNDLFQSLYGASLKADSVYIGDSQGIKVGYKQGYDFTGYKGYYSVVSFLDTSNSRFAEDQKDYNIVLGYKADKKIDIALKGIWVDNNTGADKSGTITQIKKLSQYRVIANYKF